MRDIDLPSASISASIPMEDGELYFADSTGMIVQ
jgi:hypothetical protein